MKRPLKHLGKFGAGAALIFLLALVFVPTSAQDQPPGTGGENCSSISTFCGSGCTALPTSLRPVNTTCESNCDWQSGGKCGTKTCNLFFSCACGKPLGDSVCT